jgi:hypothetical protein
LTLESLAGRFTPPSANPAQTPNEYQKNHNQWPGVGNVGSPDLDQLVAGLGGSYVQAPPPPGAAAGRQGGARVLRALAPVGPADAVMHRPVRRSRPTRLPPVS